MSVRLAVDATSVTPAGKGIARVARSAVGALADRGLDVTALAQEGAKLRAPTETVRSRPAVLWEQVGLARAGREFDVVLTFTERLPLAGTGRFAIWLFELPARRIAQNRDASAYQRGSDLLTRGLWKRSVLRAWRVVAGSEATARELEEAVPGLAGKVRVIYPGLDPQFGPGAGPDGDRYVFHLGSSDARDNTKAVVRAFEQARASLREPVRLVIGGELGTRRAELEQLGVSGLELTGRLSDEELVARYRGASAYLDATLYEGFGYHAAEAMACGVPFIGSNATSIPEVVGDAGLLYDPNDAGSLADGLTRVLEDPALADRLRQSGLARAGRFTWDRTAEAWAEVVSEA